MKMHDWERILVTAVCAALSGCTHRAQPQPPPISDLGYIDLQPGWRVRVVAPILKSGGYKVRTKGVRDDNGTITLKTGKDFEGYETDIYEVRAADNRLRVSFRSAEIHRNDGSRHGTAHPLVSIFDRLNDPQAVRLLFLTRSSDRDHDQAILAASSTEQLDRLTGDVQSDPVEKCKTHSDTSCVWVPAGVAVRPEKKRGRAWEPAR